MARRPRALCTREEVKRLLPGYREPTNPTEQASADALIDDLIDSASQRIYQVSGREFLALNDAGTAGGNDWPQPAEATRDIDVVLNPVTPPQPETGSRRSRFLKVGDLADLTGLSYGAEWSATFTTLDIAASPPRHREHPLVRADWQPIRLLEVLGDVWSGQVWRVTGRWGFPKVPPDIRAACAEQVAMWTGRDLAKFSKTFLDSVGGGGGFREPRSLSQSVYDAVVLYEVPVLG